jgi:hypothetical protein
MWQCTPRGRGMHTIACNLREYTRRWSAGECLCCWALVGRWSGCAPARCTTLSIETTFYGYHCNVFFFHGDQRLMQQKNAPGHLLPPIPPTRRVLSLCKSAAFFLRLQELSQPEVRSSIYQTQYLLRSWLLLSWLPRSSQHGKGLKSRSTLHPHTHTHTHTTLSAHKARTHTHTTTPSRGASQYVNKTTPPY